jgi:glyoxylase-like metal-dependent hydrolase (beta-lactamase superfamily II)
MKRRWILVVSAAALLAIGFVWLKTKLAALPDPDAPLTAVPLGGDAYWIRGGVSNMGFVIGASGVIAIDAQLFERTAHNALAKIREKTPKPVQFVLLTHSDPDHVNGLPAFPRSVEVIAQDNARREIVEALDSWMPGITKPARAVRNYLPQRTITYRQDLVLAGVPLVLLHVAPAHTDGDLVVFLPRQRIVYAGDLLTPEIGPYPGIHLEKNGSSLGWIQFVKVLLQLDADIFICGHGPPLTKAALTQRLHDAEERRAEIAALAAQGLPLSEIRTRLGDHPLPGIASRFPTYIETTFRELTSKGR